MRVDVGKITLRILTHVADYGVCYSARFFAPQLAAFGRHASAATVEIAALRERLRGTATHHCLHNMCEPVQYGYAKEKWVSTLLRTTW